MSHTSTHDSVHAAQHALSTPDQSSLFTPDAQSRLRELMPNFFVYSETANSWRDISSTAMLPLIEKIQNGTPWQEVVFEHTQKNNYPWLEKIVLSESRKLLLDVLPLASSMRVLDLGSGWGQLTRPLAELVAHVLSVEPNPERLTVNHAICQQEGHSNITFLQGDVFDLPLAQESVDLALLCGVFEWVAHDRSGDPRHWQTESLKILHNLIAPGGYLVIAIENRLGLKYLLGARDDHTSTRGLSYLPFVESAGHFSQQKSAELRVRTYSMSEYDVLLRDSGFALSEIFLAYPDYKIPQLLVPSSKRELLTHVLDNLQLPDEHDGIDGSHLENSAELRGLYRAFDHDGGSAAVAPSFLIVAQKK